MFAKILLTFKLFLKVFILNNFFESINKTETNFSFFNYISSFVWFEDYIYFIRKKKYSKTWELQKTNNLFIQAILNKTSKTLKGNKGYPDLIYVNEKKKLLILVEIKAIIKYHISKAASRNYSLLMC